MHMDDLFFMQDVRAKDSNVGLAGSEMAALSSVLFHPEFSRWKHSYSQSMSVVKLPIHDELAIFGQMQTERDMRYMIYAYVPTIAYI